MSITERSIGDVTILDVEGRITVLEGAPEFRDILEHLLDRGRHKILVNLAAVPYIDSTALGELVRGHTSAERRGGGLKLLDAGPPVRQLLAITRLDGAFEILENEADLTTRFAPARASRLRRD